MKILNILLLAFLLLLSYSCEEIPEIDIPTLAGEIRTYEYSIDHSSTIPNYEGTSFALYAREKVSDSTLLTNDLKGKVILLIHATITPSVSTYDLPYQNYSMMNYLARKGLDVWTFDLAGYGLSTYPEAMNDSCNLSQKDKNTLGIDDCDPTYPFVMTTSFSELDEIHTVVEYIKELRQVDKIHLFGVSLGGIRSLNYTMTHPENVERVGVNGVARYLTIDLTPEAIPDRGYPINITTKDGLLQRLADETYSEDQRDPQIAEEVWKAFVSLDNLGQSWGIGGTRYPTISPYGFLRNDIERMTTPSLIISGENDRILNPLLPIRFNLGLGLYEDMKASTQKIYIRMEDTGHITIYDYQAPNLHKIIADWVLNASVDSRSEGTGIMDKEGKYTWD